MTAVIAAAATFVVMITIATQLPHLPGPLLFILPAGVFGVVELLFGHFHFDERRKAAADRASASLATAVCIGFVWASLASPTSRECVEHEPDGCVRYELKAGPDRQGLVLWGLGALFSGALALTKSEPKALATGSRRVLEKDQWRGS